MFSDSPFSPLCVFCESKRIYSNSSVQSASSNGEISRMKLRNFITILSFHKAMSAGVHDNHENTGKHFPPKEKRRRERSRIMLCSSLRSLKGSSSLNTLTFHDVCN